MAASDAVVVVSDVLAGVAASGPDGTPARAAAVQRLAGLAAVPFDVVAGRVPWALFSTTPTLRAALVTRVAVTVPRAIGVDDDALLVGGAHELLAPLRVAPCAGRSPAACDCAPELGRAVADVIVMQHCVDAPAAVARQLAAVCASAAESLMVRAMRDASDATLLRDAVRRVAVAGAVFLMYGVWFAARVGGRAAPLSALAPPGVGAGRVETVADVAAVGLDEVVAMRTVVGFT